MQRPLTATVNLKLRLEERLRRQLEREARKADRSMNAEIIDRLEKSFVEPALLQRIDSVVKSDNAGVTRRLAELQSTLNDLQSTLKSEASTLEYIVQSYVGAGIMFSNVEQAAAYDRKHCEDELLWVQKMISIVENLCPGLVINAVVDFKQPEPASEG